VININYDILLKWSFMKNGMFFAGVMALGLGSTLFCGIEVPDLAFMKDKQVGAPVGFQGEDRQSRYRSVYRAYPQGTLNKLKNIRWACRGLMVGGLAGAGLATFSMTFYLVAGFQNDARKQAGEAINREMFVGGLALGGVAVGGYGWRLATRAIKQHVPITPFSVGRLESHLLQDPKLQWFRMRNDRFPLPVENIIDQAK
jgi:hypothetical protein